MVISMPAIPDLELALVHQDGDRFGLELRFSPVHEEVGDSIVRERGHPFYVF